MEVLFVYIGRVRFLAPTLDNADPLFALEIRPDFYLPHEEVAHQDFKSINTQFKKTIIINL